MADFGISFFPDDEVIFTAYYASKSVIFDFQLINENYWEYLNHWRWIKRAYAAYLPPFELDPDVPF